MFKPAHLLVVVSFVALGASVAVPAPRSTTASMASGPRCFKTSNVSDYRAGAPGVVQVRADGDRWFELRLSPGCPDLRSLMAVGIRPRDSSWLCEGKTDELMADSESRCFVLDIRELPTGA